MERRVSQSFVNFCLASSLLNVRACRFLHCLKWNSHPFTFWRASSPKTCLIPCRFDPAISEHQTLGLKMIRCTPVTLDSISLNSDQNSATVSVLSLSHSILARITCLRRIGWYTLAVSVTRPLQRFTLPSKQQNSLLRI